MTGRRGMQLLAGASDERLVALAHAGDEQAFAAIVERYRAPLLRYCRGFVSSGAAAEDAVQQTFINAYAALSRDDDSQVPAALRPWLYRIAHNAALNVARDPQAGLEELPEGLDGVERPDEVVAARERFRRVIGAVSALPPKQRQVIVRHAVDGESHERIATDLGMSAGSIRQLAHRARRTVREAAAALLPGPLLRVLPFGPDAAEVLPAAGGGAVLAKVAVVVVAAGAAGGGAVGGEARHRQARDREVPRAPRTLCERRWRPRRPRPPRLRARAEGPPPAPLGARAAVMGRAPPSTARPGPGRAPPARFVGVRFGFLRLGLVRVRFGSPAPARRGPIPLGSVRVGVGFAPARLLRLRARLTPARLPAPQDRVVRLRLRLSVPADDSSGSDGLQSGEAEPEKALRKAG